MSKEERTRGISKNAMRVDIREDWLEKGLLEILLQDRTTGEHIIWATDDYFSDYGADYSFASQITAEQITGKNGAIIKPRVEKDRDSQTQRSKEKAEVFTPSWVCNVQNNLIDDAWFGSTRKRFNTEKTNSWETNYYKVYFPPEIRKTWKDYVEANRLEVSCGEAPYLTSRYDTVSGRMIPVKRRVGLLDRKLRIINENVNDMKEWTKWATKALQSVYGFEWQGDNILLARENVLQTTIEHCLDRFKMEPEEAIIEEFATVISWNIWQMDGIKCVIPDSCHLVYPSEQFSFYDNSGNSIAKDIIPELCPGCKTGDWTKHNGIRCNIYDWKKEAVIPFTDMLKGAQS